jgi:hypothetical protein
MPLAASAPCAGAGQISNSMQHAPAGPHLASTDRPLPCLVPEVFGVAALVVPDLEAV